MVAMSLVHVRRLMAFLVLALAALAETAHPILPLGSPAPNFSLPGVDGKVHQLSDYSASPVLVIVFTCNHCPIASQYEGRIQKLADDYQSKGVAVVAIQPNDPQAIRIDELDSSDTSDTLEEMKIRVAYKHLRYPYLYDGATQSVARALGPQATPHVFIFDRERKLRYQGRIDSSYREELVKTQDARSAIDALLAGRPVPVGQTPAFGCSTKWKEKEASRIADQAKIDAEPVKLEPASAGDVAKLRSNQSGRLLLMSYWDTQCRSCLLAFPEVEKTFRMYRVREFDLVTVSTDSPEKKDAVLKILEGQHASSRNLLSGPTDGMGKPGTPYTVLIGLDGKVLYERHGDVDFLELRRTILAHLPADYPGFQKYWRTQ
jgi:peroxiredoxin